MRVLLIIFTLASFISCNHKADYQKEIIGIWETDSILNYENGIENMIRISDKNNMYVGSRENPKSFNYTKHNELFLIDEANNNNQNTTYKIVGDSIIHEKAYFNSIILKIDDKNLIFMNELVTIWFDDESDHPKQIMTYYLSKKE
jgi:hypothetical protein